MERNVPATRIAPGADKGIPSYTHQSSSKHADGDTRGAFINNRLTPDVVDVGRTLVAMRNANAEWAEVGVYLMCVYDFAPGVRKASAGGF